MRRTTTYISPADHRLFLRCRELNEAIRQAEGDLSSLRSLPLYALGGLLDQDLPDDARRKIQRLLTRIDEETARLNATRAELDELACEAEKAAQRIQSDGLRCFVRLFCFDGMTYTEAVNGCGACPSSGKRYAALIRTQPIE